MLLPSIRRPKPHEHAAQWHYVKACLAADGEQRDAVRACALRPRVAMIAQARAGGRASSRGLRRYGRQRRCIALVALGLVDAGAAAAAADLRAFVLAGSCLECHRLSERQTPETDGAAIPALGGRTAQEILTALMDYRAGARSGTIMPRLTRGYDSVELAEIASWLAQQGGPLR